MVQLSSGISITVSNRPLYGIWKESVVMGVIPGLLNFEGYL